MHHICMYVQLEDLLRVKLIFFHSIKANHKYLEIFNPLRAHNAHQFSYFDKLLSNKNGSILDL